MTNISSPIFQYLLKKAKTDIDACNKVHIALEKNLSVHKEIISKLDDDGYKILFDGNPAEIIKEEKSYTLVELTVSRIPPFRLPLKSEVVELTEWLKDCDFAPLPEPIKWKLPEIPKTPGRLKSQREMYENVLEIRRRLEIALPAYRKARADFLRKQKFCHKEVSSQGQDILKRIENHPIHENHKDASFRTQLMKELMDFVFRKVSIVGVCKNTIEFFLDNERRVAFVQFLFPDYRHDNIFIGNDSKGNPRYASSNAKKKIIQATLYSASIYLGYLVARFGFSDLFESIVVNVNQVWFDPATGLRKDGVIASLMASREELSNLDLTKVEPLACFRSLKGLSIPDIQVPTAIRPIMQLSRSDSRFIPSRDIEIEVDAQTNLAAMDWEDFEHLIAQVMEWEFARNGVEVKVTRASRDRGVDAVMFDPDPLRGGKYVLQAKRYTRTVDVSSVRDLYGTVMNEGANRGILITTASFGPDSYDFAKDKPLSLVDGSNLLEILQRHGKSFRIDLEEARIMQNS